MQFHAVKLRLPKIPKNFISFYHTFMQYWQSINQSENDATSSFSSHPAWQWHSRRRVCNEAVFGFRTWWLIELCSIKAGWVLILHSKLYVTLSILSLESPSFKINWPGSRKRHQKWAWPVWGGLGLNYTLNALLPFTLIYTDTFQDIVELSYF